MISKEQQIKHLLKKLEDLETKQFNGDIEILFEHGNIIHLSISYFSQDSKFTSMIENLCKNNFYGKIAVTFKEGNIDNIHKKDNLKVHLIKL